MRIKRIIQWRLSLIDEHDCGGWRATFDEVSHLACYFNLTPRLPKNCFVASCKFNRIWIFQRARMMWVMQKKFERKKKLLD